MTKNDKIWAMLLHFGTNMWYDRPYHEPGPTMCHPDARADFLRFYKPIWDDATARLAEAGANMVVIDLGEGLVYPSHPELAVKGSWDFDRFAKELERLRGLGLEPVPKLNFSASHDTWLGEYHRMVSTPEYYAACSDIIGDVCELFGKPRLFHLGYDEETAWHQKDYDFAVIRQGELWWHDFLWFVGEVERRGARPWIWSDYIWHHKDEFLKRMPKRVLQSNWYYDRDFVDASRLPAPEKGHEFFDERVYARTYADLETAGFDQIPCGSNCGCDGNFPAIVRHCRECVAPDRLKGFLMAPWLISLEVNRAKLMAAIRIFERARRDFAACAWQ